MAHRDIMHTSNPGHEYLFRWTIDDFHYSSSVQGPEFFPIPGCSDKFCFQFLCIFDSEAAEADIFFQLLDLTSNVQLQHRTVSGNVFLDYNEMKLCDETINERRKIVKCTDLMTWDLTTYNAEEQSLYGFEGCKLTLHGSLTFRGFLATSSIYSISVQKPSQDCGELAKDLRSLYESGFGSDVTFTVEDKLYHAHKLILGARSVVFAKMFEHDMLESITNNVTINDIDPDTFHEFLLFLYTGVLKEDSQPDSLYPVAKKYQVKSLHKACVALLGNRLTIDSLCESLVVADLHDDEEFKFMVKVFFRENFFNVVGTAKWAEIVTKWPALASEVLDFMKPVS